MASHELPGTHHTDIGEKGWHSGENTHLPPMWPSSFLRVYVLSGLSLLALVLALTIFCGFSGFPRTTNKNVSKC